MSKPVSDIKTETKTENMLFSSMRSNDLIQSNPKYCQNDKFKGGNNLMRMYAGVQISMTGTMLRAFKKLNYFKNQNK